MFPKHVLQDRQHMEYEWVGLAEAADLVQKAFRQGELLNACSSLQGWHCQQAEGNTCIMHRHPQLRH